MTVSKLTICERSLDIKRRRHQTWCYLVLFSDTMTMSPVEKPRPGSVTIKLDGVDRDRIASLAAAKKRTPHYLMKEAILEYVKREEARQNFIAAAESSFEHYKETGLHITMDEFSLWVEKLQENPEAPIPECHT